MDLLEKHIYELEMELLSTEVRESSEKISRLLSDDFFEFCSSGNVYNYTKGDIFASEADSDGVIGEIKDFKLKLLSDDCALGTYKFFKRSEKDSGRYSIRSSIWKKIDGGWKIVFHQGTNHV